MNRSAVCAGLMFTLSLWPGRLALGGDATPDQPDPAAGSLLSDGMVRSILKRGAHELARSLELSDQQREQVTQSMLDHWLPFAREHRAEFAPLVDRMMQAQWDPDLPPADEAQAWARQALPLHDLLTREVEASNQKIAKLLTPAQLDQFRKRAMEMNAGLSLFKVELNKMADGQLDQTMWAKMRSDREERRRRYRTEERSRRLEEDLESPELTAVSVDLWDRYVTDFISRFELDDSQRLAASSILDDVKGRARQYASTRSNELEAIQRELKASPQTERKKIFDDRMALLRPLDDLFAELRTRLEALPTEAQRSKAADSPP